MPIYQGYEIMREANEHGYATSKFLVEQMVAAARWRGARASVYRLPFLSASSTTGHFRKDHGDFLHNVVSGSLEMGPLPSLDADLSAVLPVDFLSKTLVAVMAKELSRIGKDYDFANTCAPSFDRYFSMMGGTGAKQELLPFNEWRSRVLAYAAIHPTSSVAHLVPLLVVLYSVSAVVRGYSVGNHVFGANAYPAPDMDKHYVQQYANCIRASRSED